MTASDAPEPPPSIAALLKQKYGSDTEILRRAMRGKGPAGYVSKCIRTLDRVHAIWRDPTQPEGYGHLIVSRGGRPRAGRASRETTFEVDSRRSAEQLARDFGHGGFPAGSFWSLALHVRDPEGGVDADGHPLTMVVADTSPEAGRAFKGAGFDVR